MARPRIAVDTSMLASPIRIDRLLERNIRRVVGCYDTAGTIGLHRGGDGVRLLLDVPAVVNLLEALTLEAAGRVGEGTPAQKRFSSHWTAHGAYCISIQSGGESSLGAAT